MAKLRSFKDLVLYVHGKTGEMREEYTTRDSQPPQFMQDDPEWTFAKVLVRDVEFLDQTPVEVPVQFQGAQEFSLEERIQRCLMRGRLRQYEQISIDEDEAEANDFGEDEDDDLTVHEMAGDEEMIAAHAAEKARVKAQMAEEAKAYAEWKESRSKGNASVDAGAGGASQPAASGVPPASAAGGSQAAT